MKASFSKHLITFLLLFHFVTHWLDPWKNSIMFSEHVFSPSHEDEPHIGTGQLSLLSYMNESLFFKALNSFPTPFLFCNTPIGSLEKLYYVSRACFVSLTWGWTHIGTGQLSLLSYMNESLFFKAFNPFPTTFSFRNTLIGSLSLIPV